jgi:hypothetical protein
MAPAAHAGRSCEPRALTVETLRDGLAMAEKMRQALEASGEQVVVLARSGQDLSKYQLRYSHLGYAYRQPDAQAGHVWRIVHKLNFCGTADADIYRQGLGEFFLDDPWRYEAAWVAPSADLQARLLPLLQDDAAMLRLHTLAYNMLSYPWSTRYQQSNQWVIETMAMAADSRVGSRPQAQAWLQRADYRPTTLKLGAFTRLGARITAANVAFDDHPNDKRFSDRIETVTADSVFDWMLRAGLGKTKVVVGP